jgi:hypothetical protein
MEADKNTDAVEITSLLGDTVRIPKEVYDKAKEVLDSDPDKYILFVLKAIASGSRYKLPAALKSHFDGNKLFYIEGINALIEVIEALYERKQ